MESLVMNKSAKLVLLFATAAALSACGTAVKLEDKPAVVEATPVQQQAKMEDARAVAPVAAVEVDPLNDPQGVLANRSVYFDFDSYTVKSDFNSLLSNHANYLSAHTTRKILIQGNTDERGGREYNLALGQKRAEAVRKSLSALGVSDSQTEAVSLGKEKPKATGSTEEAWAQNRRADIVY
jgi:peptidoglycan-associated lipoprotein